MYTRLRKSNNLHTDFTSAIRFFQTKKKKEKENRKQEESF